MGYLTRQAHVYFNTSSIILVSCVIYHINTKATSVFELQIWSNFFSVTDDKTNKMLHHVEKPEDFISNTINARVYVFDCAVFHQPVKRTPSKMDLFEDTLTMSGYVSLFGFLNLFENKHIKYAKYTGVVSG